MTNAAEKIEIEPLGAAAKRALVEAGGDVRRAADLLRDRAMEDRAFLDAHFGVLIRDAAYKAVAHCIRADRRVVWTTPQPTTQERSAQVAALASGTAQTLLDFALPGGKLLRNATRAEVAEAASFYAKQARDMSWKSRWLDHVAQSLPDGKRVADVLSPERLEELRQEITQ